MRKLAWFTAGFAGACLACFYWLNGSVVFLMAALAFVVGITLVFLGRLFSAQRFIAAILIGAAFGLLYTQIYKQIELKPAQSLDEKSLRLSIEITDYSFETAAGIGADGRFSYDGAEFAVRLYVQDIPSLTPGDRVEGIFALNYTGVGDLGYLLGDGIHFRAFTEELAEVVYADTLHLQYYPVFLSERICTLIEEVFPGDTYAFAKAILLGNDEDLSYEEDIAFRNSGIRHIIAVSGLHISILLSVVFYITRRRRFLTPLVGIPLLLFFAAVVGFTPSVNRACLMHGLMLLSLMLNKEYDPPTSLAFAVLTILIFDPLSVSSVGFQLSVSSILGIFLFREKIHNYLSKLKYLKNAKGNSRRAKCIRWFTGTVSVSAAAIIFTLPVGAFYFRSFSLVGLLSNLLVLGVVTYIFCGIAIACILGLIWAPLGVIAAWGVSWPMRYVSLVAQLLSRLPLGNIPADNLYMVIFLLFAYALLVLFLRTRGIKLWAVAACGAFAFVICACASVVEHRADTFRVSVLDVGQGQCVLIQSGNDCYMVDCGGDSDKRTAETAVRSLWSAGVYRLDGLILTHYDQDHVGGIYPLLSQIQAEAIYLPNDKNDTELRTQLEDNFRGEAVCVEQITVLPCGKGTITILPAHAEATGNQCSMCILFQVADCDILITGDRNLTGEIQLMEQIELPDIEALIVGHHGSDSSTGLDLLRKTTPEIAVISVGRDNHYGHPGQETLGRLSLFGCKILRTDLHGTIILRR